MDVTPTLVESKGARKCHNFDTVGYIWRSPLLLSTTYGEALALAGTKPRNLYQPNQGLTRTTLAVLKESSNASDRLLCCSRMFQAHDILHRPLALESPGSRLSLPVVLHADLP